MAVQDYDLPTEPLYRRDHDFFKGPRQRQPELDRGTLWAGIMLGAALVLFMTYMFFVGPNT